MVQIKGETGGGARAAPAGVPAAVRGCEEKGRGSDGYQGLLVGEIHFGTCMYIHPICKKKLVIQPKVENS